MIINCPFLELLQSTRSRLKITSPVHQQNDGKMYCIELAFFVNEWFIFYVFTMFNGNQDTIQVTNAVIVIKLLYDQVCPRCDAP